MTGEMIKALVVNASGTATWSHVESQTLRANTGHQFRSDAVILGCPDGIEIVKDWPILDVDEIRIVIGLGGAHRDFAVDAHIVEEQHIAAKVDIHTARERWRNNIA